MIWFKNMFRNAYDFNFNTNDTNDTIVDTNNKRNDAMIYHESKYFKLQEYVDPATFAKIGHSAWKLLDARLLWTMDKIKERYEMKPVRINDWLWEGGLKYRGYRPIICNVGAKLSQHKFGRAVDFDINDINSSVIRKDIRDNPNDEAFKYITAIEDFTGMSWVHIDVRNNDKETNGIQIFGN